MWDDGCLGQDSVLQSSDLEINEGERIYIYIVQFIYIYTTLKNLQCFILQEEFVDTRYFMELDSIHKHYHSVHHTVQPIFFLFPFPLFFFLIHDMI